MIGRQTHLTSRLAIVLRPGPLLLVVLLAGCTTAIPASPPAPEPTGDPRPSVTLDPATPPVTGGTFAATGSLDVPRSGHRALLLRDGRVLVIGGHDGGGEMPIELYDPSSGSFASMPPIAAHDGSNGFSATVLADGRVLIAGGRLVDGRDLPWPAADRAVLFDPTSGEARPTGAMTVGREGHAATLLADGRVLIVGGIGTVTPPNGEPQLLTSAEIYDPATETFRATGDMSCSRSRWLSSWDRFTTTVLSSGRVLVHDGGCPTVSASGRTVTGPDEIFDPARGTFDTVLAAGRREADPNIVVTVTDRVYRYDLLAATLVDVTPQPADIEAKFGENCRSLPSDCTSGMTITPLASGQVLLAGAAPTSPTRAAPTGTVASGGRQQACSIRPPASSRLPTGSSSHAPDTRRPSCRMGVSS
jgi:hypothetical protein